MSEIKITERIDTWKLRHMDFPDPKVLGMLAEIELAIKHLRDGRGHGPYGTIEVILSAIDMYIDDYNE